MLKEKASVKRAYKCTVCGTTRSSVQLINEHHLKDHKPQICPTCGKTFALASTLIKHMYTHEEQRFQCDACDFSSHFESELNSHKIVHRKNPSFQCMVKNCGKWFHRKWELTSHLQKHQGKQLKCDQCDFTTNIKKHL